MREEVRRKEGWMVVGWAVVVVVDVGRQAARIGIEEWKQRREKTLD